MAEASVEKIYKEKNRFKIVFAESLLNCIVCSCCKGWIERTESEAEHRLGTAAREPRRD